MTNDPFAGIDDEPDPGPAGTLAGLLGTALRGFVPLRKVFVQKPNTNADRASVLAALVHGRHQRPLDALLLLHALHPILSGSPLTLGTWARILSTRTRCTPAGVTKAFDTLADLRLVERVRGGSVPVILPLLEDGSGTSWTRPGLTGDAGPGYLTLPHEYWTSGYADQLTVPGKAMLLIMLAETQDPKKTAFSMPVERAHEWYGISERTAERGYGELHKAGVLLVKKTKVADPRHPAGRRDVFWRALSSPFSTDHRTLLRQNAIAAHKGRGATATTDQAETVSATP
jgi:hypothetical protein